MHGLNRSSRGGHAVLAFCTQQRPQRARITPGARCGLPTGRTTKGRHRLWQAVGKRQFAPFARRLRPAAAKPVARNRSTGYTGEGCRASGGHVREMSDALATGLLVTLAPVALALLVAVLNQERRITRIERDVKWICVMSPALPKRLRDREG